MTWASCPVSVGIGAGSVLAVVLTAIVASRRQSDRTPSARDARETFHELFCKQSRPGHSCLPARPAADRLAA
jgi:hypothetical protein